MRAVALELHFEVFTVTGHTKRCKQRFSIIHRRKARAYKLETIYLWVTLIKQHMAIENL